MHLPHSISVLTVLWKLADPLTPEGMHETADLSFRLRRWLLAFLILIAVTGRQQSSCGALAHCSSSSSMDQYTVC